ncbi:MAG: U32 family peptidase [Oscillospiraceae bacterium]|nr:U32 family peptidase [Oscillospiraceae bacterium]
MRPEILAPAGSFESVLAAVRCGADAVYVGGTSFSARANAVNFSDGELEKAAEYCHLHGVKIYRAMNTLVFAEEMADFLSAAKFSAEVGVDGLIVQDIGAARLLREMLPDMRLNASTQMTIHTPEGARLAAEMGFSRVVAARELDLSALREMVSTGVEIEAFIHGALCMSVSGQCYMSAMIGSRSANRGLCAQACRLPFSGLGEADPGERHDLSLKDLCGILHMKALAEAGVTSLKIEGRMKRAEYVAAAVTACRAALDGKEPDLDTLQAVFSRSGFTDGYITGSIGAPMFGFRRKDDVTAAEAVLPGLKESFRKEVKGGESCRADFFAEIKRGRPARLTMQCGDIAVSAEGAVPEEAKNRPADLPYVKKQIEKLGDTIYTISNISAEIDDGLMISAAALNALRREAAEKMDRALILSRKPEYKCNDVDLYIESESRRPSKIRVRVSNMEQLGAVSDKADEIILPLRSTGEISADDRFIIAPPRFILNEEKIKSELLTAKEKGFKRLLCVNLAYIKIGRELGFELSGGFGLNIVNPYAVKTAAEMELTDITAGVETKLSHMRGLCGDVPVAVIVYGRLPVMLTRNCPIKQAAGCSNCKGSIIDRTGRSFPVVCDGASCEILNSDILMMTDRLGEINADILELDFTDESVSEVSRVIKCCRDGRKALDKGFTRGLYYRGIQG